VPAACRFLPFATSSARSSIRSSLQLGYGLRRGLICWLILSSAFATRLMPAQELFSETSDLAATEVDQFTCGVATPRPDASR
jgi:hypothetical protein